MVCQKDPQNTGQILRMSDFLFQNAAIIFVLSRVLSQPFFAWFITNFKLAKSVTVSKRRLVAQRLARLVVGVIITLYGFAAAFIYERDELYADLWFSQPWRIFKIYDAFVIYLLVDSLEIIYAYVVHSCPLQPDMLFHHVAGMYFFGSFAYSKVGPFCVFALPGELLTLFSGTVFFASALDREAHPWASGLFNFASTCRFYFLPFYRGPIWIYLQYLLISEMLAPTFPARVGEQRVGAVQTALCCAYALDIYWIGMLMGWFSTKGEVKPDSNNKEK